VLHGDFLSIKCSMSRFSPELGLTRTVRFQYSLPRVQPDEVVHVGDAQTGSAVSSVATPAIQAIAST
jgi:hypothetical protein